MYNEYREETMKIVLLVKEHQKLTELARRMKVGRQTLSYWISGRTPTPLYQSLELASRHGRAILRELGVEK